VLFWLVVSRRIPRALGGRLSGSFWLGWQLKNRGLLTFAEVRQQHNLTVWKLDCVMMRRRFFFVDLPKDCGPVIDNLLTPA
jgi:hypothetical protein